MQKNWSVETAKCWNDVSGLKATMLKKFLQFLKGSEENEIQGHGSYLDQLLGKVRPIVAEELDHCPEHDPLLVLVVSILRTTMPNRWESEIPCPLSDTQSPPLKAPKPPPVTPGEDVEELDETSIVEESIIEDEEQPGESTLSEESSVVEGVRIDDADEAQADDEDRGEDGEVGDSEELVDEEDAEASVEEEQADDEGIVEDERATVDDEEISDADETQERLIGGATDGTTGAAGLDEESIVEAEPPVMAGSDSILEESSVNLDVDEPNVGEQMDLPLDAPEVLQTGRVFLGMLIENDRMPVEMQMSVAETMLARDLLLGYFLGSAQFEGKARELLTIVEEKFSDGAFSQARILLQLFQTDRKTQVNNARNLFFEDMILRMGIRRRNRVTSPLGDQLAERLASCETLNDKLVAVGAFFRERLHVEFHLFARDSDGVDVWSELAERSRRRHAAEQLLRYLPPKRWRPMDSFPNPPSQVVHAHISQATMRKYVLRQIKACYFVLRAVGDTGLEPYLDSFFDWSESQFDVNGVQLMPMIYRRTMSDSQLVEQIFEGVYSTFFTDQSLEFLRGLNPETVEDAVDSAIDKLTKIDFNEVAPGHYDFGGLIFDELLGIEYPDDEFGFKLHRLT